MNRKLIFGCALLSAIAVMQVHAFAQSPRLLPPVVSTGGKEEPKQKDKDKKDKDKKDKDKKPTEKLTEPPQTDIFSPLVVPRADSVTVYTPQMLGDWGNKFVRQTITVFGSQTTTTTTFISGFATGTTTTTGSVAQTRTVLAPLPNQGAFKVAENESPRPMDRVFGFYNYYNSVFTPRDLSPASLTTSTTGSVLGGQTVTTTTFLPGTPRYADLHREVFGFEKTFLGGNASVEVRVPIMQQIGSAGTYDYNHMGDITIVTKYAVINDRVTGNVLSGGLAITAPTSPDIVSVDGNFHSVLLQPWFGYIYNLGNRAFIQGIHSVVVPTDQRDVTLMFNDIGFGIWAYQGNGLISFIVPTGEVHVTTPLNNRNIDTATIVVTDAVVLTGGVHIGLGRSWLTVGASSPVTGPQPYTVEAFLQFNVRF